MNTKHYFRLVTILSFLISFLSTSGKLHAQAGDEKENQPRHEENYLNIRSHDDLEHESDAADDHGMDWPHKLTFGVGGGLNYNMANGNTTYLIDGNQYDWGHGYGPELHLLLEVPLGGQWMLAPRVNYSMISTAFTDGTPIAGNGAAAIPDIAFDVRNLGVELLTKFAINRFHLMLGPTVAIMMKKTWAHGTYTNSDNTWQDIPGTHRTFAAIAGGAGYDAPLNTKNTMWLTPEIVYSYPLTNLGDADHNDLKISTIRGAISLKFDISPSEAPPPTPVQPPKPLSVTVTAKGIMPNGEATNEPVLPEQTIHTRESVPLLPYVFFEEASAEIPSRYSRTGATGFNEKQLDGKDPLEVNHAVLDVIGSRMKDNPDVSVTIIGTNSNTGPEHHNLALSKERAEAIRNYLAGTWGISEDRISVDERNLPELATNPVTQPGIEENRRAEIVATDAKITDPVKIENSRSEFNGETLIRYETTVSNPDNIPVSNWRITLDDNGSQVGTESGGGVPPAVINSKIPDADKYVGRQLHYSLDVTDANGKNYSADGMTTVEKATTGEQKYLERFAMLNFDFDSSKVNEHAEKMLSLISESVNKEALGVNINGYCDITGTDEYNQALSERRATSAASALQSGANMPANVTVSGHGRQDPKFPNDLPEGRMLNRRVEVDIAKSK